MELLLNLKGFKGRIQQIDRNRAKYPVEIGYTLVCNITRNVSEWAIKSPDPDNEGEYLAIHYADFSEPKKAYDNATEVIKAYQEALINRSLGIEEKPVEEPMPGNLPRTRAKGPRVLEPDQAAEEAKAKREAQRKEAEAKYTEYIIDEGTESNRVAEEVKAQESEDIQEDQDLPADPEGEVRDQEETPKIEYQNHEWEDVEKEEVQDQDLPADPEEEAVQEEAVQEEAVQEEAVQEEAVQEEAVQALSGITTALGALQVPALKSMIERAREKEEEEAVQDESLPDIKPIINPNLEYVKFEERPLKQKPKEDKTIIPFLEKQIEEHNKRMEELENREPVKPCTLKSGWTPLKICSYCGGEVYYHTVGGPQNSFIHCHKCGTVYYFDDFKELEDSENRGQPGEVLPDWDEKDQDLQKKIDRIIEQQRLVFSQEPRAQPGGPGEPLQDKIKDTEKEIIRNLWEEVVRAEAGEYDKGEDPEREKRFRNLEKNLETLGVLQDIQGLQLQGLQLQGQGPGPGPQEERNIQELRITLNPGGYSWKIILRGESLEEILEAGIKANEFLKRELK